MALTHVLLFFHLLGAVAFFAGAAVAGTLQLAAIRRERPSEVYALLRLAPIGAVLVGIGALLTLVFGIALAEHEGFGFSPAWIRAALGLWIASMVVGAYGGRTARHARHLAEGLAAEGDAPSPKLHALVAAPGPLAASLASGVMLLAILVLMVWQPGGDGPTFASPPTSAPSAFQDSVERRIVANHPQRAYFPTRLPLGYELSEYTVSPDGRFSMRFTRHGDATTELTYGAGPTRSCPSEPSPVRTFHVNGVEVFWSGTSGDQQAWRCSDGVIAQVDGFPGGDESRRNALNLATLVAYTQKRSADGPTSASPPTSPPSVFQKSVERKIVANEPQLAYFPTRLPAGYALSEYIVPPDGGFTMRFTRHGDATTELFYSLDDTGTCSRLPSPMKTFHVNGVKVLWSATSRNQSAWSCSDGVTAEVLSGVDASRRNALALATVVAYVKKRG